MKHTAEKPLPDLVESLKPDSDDPKGQGGLA
jgi:hypothetical protein